MKNDIDEIIQLTRLFDMYGGLLPDNQRKVFEFYLDDYSLSEIAENNGVSRQAIHDIIKRGAKELEHYSEVLKLEERKAALLSAVLEIKEVVNTSCNKDLINAKIDALLELFGE
ncbi:MAG: DNA-binding protein [Lachnospiraceae bacterium]|nr:DNA-binding protein [Lachnospiraceae bacterium]